MYCPKCFAPSRPVYANKGKIVWQCLKCDAQHRTLGSFSAYEEDIPGKHHRVLSDFGEKIAAAYVELLKSKGE